MTVAIIAATAAILGTLTGGVATYLGNRLLQERELNREEAQQTAAARAVARLLRSEYETDSDRLLEMSSAEEYSEEIYRKRVFVSRIGQDDRKLLARRLSEAEWTAVSNAEQMIERVETELEIHRGRGEIGQFEEKTLQQARTACNAASAALASLSRG
jgi:hypothetical protein